MQDIHNDFIKAVLTDCSAFKSLSKKVQEQAAAALIIALIFARKTSHRKRGKKESA